MNSDMGLSSKLRRLTAPVCGKIRGELAIGAHLRAANFTGGELVTREHGTASRNLLPPHMGSPRQPSLVLFPIYINSLPMWTLWSCGRRVSVVQAQRQIHRVLLATDTAAGETMRPRRATRR